MAAPSQRVKTLIVWSSAVFLLVSVMWHFRAEFRLCWLGPRLSCQDPSFDFKESQISSKVFHRFELHNDGLFPLHVYEVKPDCGCTLAALSGESAGSGGRLTLDVTLSLDNVRGTIRRAILVRTNDFCRPMLSLQISGTSTHQLTVVPRELRLSRESSGESFVLKSVDLSKFRLQGITHLPVGVTVDWNQDGQARSFHEVRIAVTSAVDLNIRSFTLELETDHPVERKVEVLVQLSG